MKTRLKQAGILVAAAAAMVQLVPGAAYAASEHRFCTVAQGGVCTITTSHASRGTVSIDVSSSDVTGSSVQWEIGGAGGYLCVGRVPDDGRVHSYNCFNVPAGTMRAGIFAGGGRNMELGLRF